MEILDQSTTVIIDDQHLDNMELSVMASIRQERRPRLNGIRILRWTSVVAASLLLMLFIGEQSYTVSKITRLEERLAGIDYTRNPELIDRLTILESREIIAKSLRAAYGKQLIGRPSTPFSFSAFAESKAWIDSLRQGGYFERYIPQRTNPFLHTAFIVKTK
jgi:hypothetical protein